MLQNDIKSARKAMDPAANLFKLGGGGGGGGQSAGQPAGPVQDLQDDEDDEDDAGQKRKRSIGGPGAMMPSGQNGARKIQPDLKRKKSKP